MKEEYNFLLEREDDKENVENILPSVFPPTRQTSSVAPQTPPATTEPFVAPQKPPATTEPFVAPQTPVTTQTSPVPPIIPPADTHFSHFDITNIVEKAKAEQFINPTELLRFLQKEILVGRVLDIVELDVDNAGETNQISVDRDAILETAFS